MSEINKGFSTSEFKLTGVGMLLSALLALLSAFNVLTLTPEQKTSLYEFCAIAWMVLPGLYVLGRSHVKASIGKAPDPQTVVENKNVGTETNEPEKEAKKKGKK